MNRLIIIGALAVGCASLAVTASAAATPGNGAQVVRSSGCQDVLGTGTLCYDSRSVVNRTETPSGIVSQHFHDRSVATFVGSGSRAGCHSRSASRSQAHELYRVRGGVADAHQRHVLHVHTLTSEGCPSTPVLCRLRQNYTFANGESRHVRTEVDCQDPATA